MAVPFYAKGPGNEGYIKNMEVLAFDELDGGSIFQPQLYRTPEGKYYLYGTMGPQIGILEVTDPANPRFIKRFDSVGKDFPGSSNPKCQVADGLLVTGMCSGGGPWVPGMPPKEDKPAEICKQGIHIFDLKKDPENPEFLGYWDCGVPNSNGVHRFMYDGGPYVHVSSECRGFEGLIYRCVDISDPTHPVEAGRWWMPHQYADGFIGRHGFNPNDPHVPEFMAKGWLHGPPFVRDGLAYCGYCGDGLVILNVEDVTRPYIVGHLPLCPPFASHYGGAKTHTALPLPGRDLVVVTNEGERYMWFVPNNDPNIQGKKIGNMAQALNNLHMVDVSDPAHPTLIAEFPYPEVPENFPYKNFQQLGLGLNGTFGPHNIHEPMPGKPWLEQRGDRVYCCYFHAGLRVYDVSDEFVPREIAYFIPPNPNRPQRLPGPNIACTEDLCVDDRGNIFIVTNNDGMYVLRMKEQ